MFRSIKPSSNDQRYERKCIKIGSQCKVNHIFFHTDDLLHSKHVFKNYEILMEINGRNMCHKVINYSHYNL